MEVLFQLKLSLQVIQLSHSETIWLISIKFGAQRAVLFTNSDNTNGVRLHASAGVL